MDWKWFLGTHDLDELISFIERTMQSIDRQLGETNKLLEEIKLSLNINLPNAVNIKTTCEE
jgi:hypothetical protein